ncbi:MAG: carboxymuconolactone decarboxylase family protein [Pseudomonadota bacterium]
MKRHSERRAGGIDTLRTLSGGSFDPDRAARAMVRRHGALGTYGVDHILGNLWNRPTLSRRDRSLIVVTFLTTIGATDELAFHIEGALNHGLTRDEVEEILLQVAGYAGFPMAMAASRIVDAVWRKLDGVERLPARQEAECLDDDERWRRANAVRSVMWGGRNADDPEADRDAIVEYLGGVGEQAFDFAFGELWARDALSKRDRSLVTVAILAISRCTDELKIHLRVGLNHGCTRAELEEVMVQLTGYGGFPKAVEGLRTARALFAKLDERARS